MTAYTKRLQKVTAVLCTTALLAGCAAGTSDNTEPCRNHRTGQGHHH